MEGAIAGAPFMVVKGPNDPAIGELKEDSSIKIEASEDGITIKADAIGSLEALSFETKEARIPIRKFSVGDITRRDVVETAHGDKANQVILGFNVSISKDAEAEIENCNVKVFTNQIVYRLIEEYQEWVDESKKKVDTEKRSEFSFPAKFKILPNCIFRASKPAIVGVRVLAGRIKIGERLIGADGRDAGRIKSIHLKEDTLKEAKQGDEVAIGIEGVTAGRQINEEDIIYIDLIESAVKELATLEINDDERAALEETIRIKRKEDPFWGM
jgi:translation initiation factor 5B